MDRQETLGPCLESLETRMLMDAQLNLNALGRAQFYDADGDLVKVQLTGGGTGTLTFSGDRTDALSLELSGLTPRSSLTFTVTGPNKTTTIGGIEVAGPLKSIKGAAVSLTGQGLVVHDGGYVLNVTLDDLRNGADIRMPASPERTPVTLRLDRLGAGSDINAPGLFVSLDAAFWASGALTAAYASKIQLDGSLGANLTLTGGDASDQSIKTLAVGEVLSGKVEAEHGIGSLTAMSITGQGIHADWLGSLKTTGRKTNLRNGIGSDAGDLNATLTLDGQHEPAGKLVLGSATLAGSLKQTAFVSGDAGKVKLRNLLADLMINGRATVTVQDALTLAEPVGGEIGLLRVTGPSTITSRSGTVRTTYGLFYANASASYRTHDLAVPVLKDNSMTYQMSVRGYSGVVNASANTTISGSTITTSYSAMGRTGYSMTWQVGQDGSVALTRLYSSSDMVDLDAQLSLSLPAELAIGQKYVSTSSVSGTLGFEYDDEWIETDLPNGTATATAQLLGHEQVRVDGITYMAIKASYKVSLSSAGLLDLGDREGSGKYRMTSTATVWIVPEQGAVRIECQVVESGSVNGHSGSASQDVTLELVTN